MCSRLVVQAAHGQIDGSSRHPARLIGSHENRHVSHLGERHKPSWMGSVCEDLLPLSEPSLFASLLITESPKSPSRLYSRVIDTTIVSTIVFMDLKSDDQRRLRRI